MPIAFAFTVSKRDLLKTKLTVSNYKVSKMNVKIIPLASVVIILLAGCKNDSSYVAPKACDNSKLGSFCTYDALREEMTKRVTDNFASDGAFQIITQPYSYEIGQVIKVKREGNKVTTDLVSRSVCNPLTPTPAIPAEDLFPPFISSWNAAANLGLNDAVFRKLADLNIGLNVNQEVSVTVKNTRYRQLAVDDLVKIVKRRECLNMLNRKDTVVVRGYIEGMRSFKTVNALKGNLKVGFAKIGNVSLEAGRNRTVTLEDTVPAHFVLIVANVKVKEDLGNDNPSNYKATISHGVRLPEITRDRKLSRTKINNVENPDSLAGYSIQFEKPAILDGVSSITTTDPASNNGQENKVDLFDNSDGSTINPEKGDEKGDNK